MKNIEKYLITLFLFLLTQSSFTFAQSSNSNFPNCTSGNCINGKGTADFSNGDHYEGDFKNKEMHGQGTMKFKNLGTYTGAFETGKAAGKGKVIFLNGESYEGDFMDNNFNGLGVYDFNNGDQYIGNWVDDKKDGTGTFTFANGDYYVGQFKSDKMNGAGKKFDKKGNLISEGIWKSNVFASTSAKPKAVVLCISGDCNNGKGKLDYKNGYTLEAEFKNGKANGFGVFYKGNEVIYEGQFVDNFRTGKGKGFTATGDYYEGNWLNNELSGEGIIKFADKTWYSGQFKNNKKDGYGREYDTNQKLVREGYFKNDSFVPPKISPSQQDLLSTAKDELNNVTKENELVGLIYAEKQYVIHKMKAALAIVDNDKARLPLLVDALKKQKEIVKLISESLDAGKFSGDNKINFQNYLEGDKNLLKTLDEAAVKVLTNIGLD